MVREKLGLWGKGLTKGVALVPVPSTLEMPALAFAEEPALLREVEEVRRRWLAEEAAGMPKVTAAPPKGYAKP